MTIRNYLDFQPEIATTAWVDESAMVIGRVRLGENVSVWPMAVVRGDVQEINIGDYSNIQDNAVVHVTHASEYCPQGRATNIGRYVIVGHGAVVHACTIDDECLIGINSTILDGAHLEKWVIVAAGSVVAPNQVLESGWLYTGAPARKKRLISDKERDYFRYSATHYAKLSKIHKNSF